MITEEEHLRHMNDGRWHDDCRFCRLRRRFGGTGIARQDILAPPPIVGTDVYKGQCQHGILAPQPSGREHPLLAHYCMESREHPVDDHGCGCGYHWDDAGNRKD